MLNAEIKSKIDKLWNNFWSGGISNPLTVIEQISYLLFIKRLDDISPFNRFMFELGLLAPVKYLKNGPIRDQNTPIINKIKKRLIDYDFKVYVNNVEIFKPILFPHKADLPLYGKEPYKVYEKEIDIEFNDRKIRALCYYYHQNVRIIPYELRGLLLRVKNIGIGNYDNNFSRIASESPIVLHPSSLAFSTKYLFATRPQSLLI